MTNKNLPEWVKKHPLAAAIQDDTINVGHATDLLRLKAELLAQELQEQGLMPVELEQMIVKAREVQFWAKQLFDVLGAMRKASDIVVARDMPGEGT